MLYIRKNWVKKLIGIQLKNHSKFEKNLQNYI